MNGKALVLIDVQNDFMPGGALPVREGDRVVPVANALLARKERFDLVVASQDWHPRGHGSFASSHPGRKPGELVTLGGVPQVLWPDHCVQGTPGAEFQPRLAATAIDAVFRKGTDPGIDSYSAFFDNGHKKDTGLGDFLEKRGIRELVLLGLATDYCVKFSALDARALGFAVSLVEDGCRGVELAPGDSEKALAELRAAGVIVRDSGALLRGRFS